MLAGQYGPSSFGDGVPDRGVLRSKKALRQIGLLFLLMGE